MTMTIAPTVYVIVRNVWNDNSEICYQPDDGGGIPETAYYSRAKAEEALAHLEYEAKLTAILSSHAYDVDEIITNGTRWRSILQVYGIKHPNEGEWYSISDLDVPENIKKEMVDCLAISFYEIHEVPIEQTREEQEIEGYSEDDRFKELDI